MSFIGFYTKSQFQYHPYMMRRNDFAVARLHFAAKRLLAKKTLLQTTGKRNFTRKKKTKNFVSCVQLFCDNYFSFSTVRLSFSQLINLAPTVLSYPSWERGQLIHFLWVPLIFFNSSHNVSQEFVTMIKSIRNVMRVNSVFIVLVLPLPPA